MSAQARPGGPLHAWVKNLFRPLLLALMLGCVAWPLARLARMLFPAWREPFLVGSCMLAAVEAYYSYRLLRSERMLGANTLRFRLIELALLFILVKAGSYIGQDLAEVVAELRNWPRAPASLFDFETLAAFLLAFMGWGEATFTTHDLESIGEPPERTKGYQPPHVRLTDRFFVGGALLLLLTGLAQLDAPGQLLDLGRPLERGPVLSVLAYFLLGLSMLGQIRFEELRQRWQGQDLRVADEIAGRWALYSLAFIGLAALLAALLPTGHTLGLLDPIAASLGVLAILLFYLASLFFALLLFPFTLLMWLLATLFAGPQQPRRPMPELPVEPPPQLGSGGASWWEIVWPLIFWALVLGGIVYVVRSYLRDRPELAAALKAYRPRRSIRQALVTLVVWLKRWLRRAGQAVGERLPQGLPGRLSHAARSIPGPARFLRLGALSPRERVLYYYLSILRRAGQQGFPRQGHQTPHEYIVTLEHKLPEAEQDLQGLTHAFVEARYSRREVVPEREREARGYWQRVKAALQALKRKSRTR